MTMTLTIRAFAFLLVLFLLFVDCSSDEETGCGSCATQESLHITTTILNHQSTTRVTATYSTFDPRFIDLSTVTFSFVLPTSSYVSAFSMEIDGVVHRGIVLEKAEAESRFNSSVSVAGIVVPRENEEYVFVAKLRRNKTVTFELVYEEVLRRILGVYRSHLYVATRQAILKGVSVRIEVIERSGILFLNTPDFYALSDLNRTVVDATKTLVEYHEDSVSKIRKMNFSMGIEYAVGEYADPVGMFLFDHRSPYFVHVFAPKILPVGAGNLLLLPKSVVFVLDVSGSMRGTRIAQAKEAFNAMIDELNLVDNFVILSFASAVTKCDLQLKSAISTNVVEAKQCVDAMVASGSTNMNQALLDAIGVLNSAAPGVLERAAMVVLLTDGNPTSGVTATGSIRANALAANTYGFPIFTLGFGSGVSFEFLQGIAEDNNGNARRIYEGSDVGDQLAGFFDEIRSVLLKDLTVEYDVRSSGLDIGETTKTSYPQFYNGSEVIVVGEIVKAPSHDPVLHLIVNVSAVASSGRIEWGQEYLLNVEESTETVVVNTERIYRYETMRHRLLKWAIASTASSTTKKNLALDFALKHQLVTPLTAMFVQAANVSEGNNNNGAKDSGGGGAYYPQSPPGGGGYPGGAGGGYTGNPGGSGSGGGGTGGQYDPNDPNGPNDVMTKTGSAGPLHEVSKLLFIAAATLLFVAFS